MKKICLVLLLLSVAGYTWCPETRSFLLWKDPAGSWKVHLYIDGNKYYGFDDKDLLGNLRFKDGASTLIPSLSSPKELTVDSSKDIFYFAKNATGWEDVFYDLQAIKNKKFPVTPNFIEPVTYQILNSPQITDLITAYENAPEDEPETGADTGPKLSGMTLIPVTGTSECEKLVKDTYIKHLWRHAGSPAKNPVNDQFFVYFFKESDTDQSGRGGAYATFANTCYNGKKDPMANGFTTKNFKITVKGKEYDTSEHYFQINKFNNPDDAYTVMAALRADQLPDFARRNNTKYGGQRSDWKTGGSINTMIAAVRAKFGQHKDLGKLLLSTYPKILVEDTAQRSKGDEVWGAHFNYSGCNQLGQVLMHVRQELTDGKFYAFKKGDAKVYYDLLSGKTSWTQDTNPDKQWIPDGYDQVLTAIQAAKPPKKIIPKKPLIPPAKKLQIDSDLLLLTQVLRSMA